MNITECVGADKMVHFDYFREGHFYYRCENGFLFPVPLDDIGQATLLREDKSVFFMRWIRKHIETIRLESIRMTHINDVVNELTGIQPL